MFRTIGDGPSLWESSLPPELLRLPEELARVDALLDGPAFFDYCRPDLGRGCDHRHLAAHDRTGDPQA